MLLDRAGRPRLIHKTRKLINELNKLSAENLEIMASLYYLYRESPTSNKEELISKLSHLKPHRATQIQSALEVFEIMCRYQTE